MDKSGKFTMKEFTSGRRVIESVVHTFEEGVHVEATISPLFFSRRHLKTGDIVWPAEISGLLQEKSYGGNWKKKIHTY